MSLWKAGLLALAIPTALTAPALAQEAQGPGPRFIFQELDADGNGAVTLEELQAARPDRFAAADADADGFLTRDELLAQGALRVAQGVDRMLERADTDADGQLTMAELDAAREDRMANGGWRGRLGREGHEGRGGHGGREGREGRGPNPEQMFGHMDADGDGSVTEAEFDAAVAQMLERMGRRFGGDRG